MTQSVYIIGGAGAGKSTFTGQLLNRMGLALSPQLDLHSKPNSRGTVITLRGHLASNAPRFGPGLYLGCMRDSFPGTDGLDRVSYIPGEEWLERGAHEGFDFIIGEGATLAVRRFIRALHMNTELLLLHLVCDEMVKDLRLTGRGSAQADSFVTGTTTRATNLAADMAKEGVDVRGVETSDPDDWEQALAIAVNHLGATANDVL